MRKNWSGDTECGASFARTNNVPLQVILKAFSYYNDRHLGVFWCVLWWFSDLSAGMFSNAVHRLQFLLWSPEDANRRRVARDEHSVWWNWRSNRSWVSLHFYRCRWYTCIIRFAHLLVEYIAVYFQAFLIMILLKMSWFIRRRAVSYLWLMLVHTSQTLHCSCQSPRI